LLINGILIEFEQKSIGLEEGELKSWKSEENSKSWEKEAKPNSANLSPTLENSRAKVEKCAMQKT